MIETFLDEKKLPFRTLEQKVFDAAVDYVFRNLPKWGREVNATLGAFNALAAGGVYAFPYVFDSSTADSDPGVGRLRLGSATQNAATAMRMDLQAVGGAEMTNVLADLRAATSAVKGSVRLVKMSDPSKWLIFDVTAVALPSGYRNLTVTWRATGGGQASPFANGDALMVFIDRNGDSGSVPGATDLVATIPVANGVAAVNALNVFDTDHDWYQIHISGLSQSAASHLRMRLAVAGVLASGATDYYRGDANTAIAANSRTTNFICSSDAQNNVIVRRSVIMQIGNVNSNDPKLIMWDGMGQDTTPSLYTQSVRGAFNPASVVTGFGFYLDIAGVTFTGGSIRVYGVRKA